MRKRERGSHKLRKHQASLLVDGRRRWKSRSLAINEKEKGATFLSGLIIKILYCCCSYLRTHRRKKSKKEAERILLPSLLLAAVAAVRPLFSRVCSTTHLNGKIWGKNKESQWCTCISFQQKCSIASNCFWNSITFSGYTVYCFLRFWISNL